MDCNGAVTRVRMPNTSTTTWILSFLQMVQRGRPAEWLCGLPPGDARSGLRCRCRSHSCGLTFVWRVPSPRAHVELCFPEPSSLFASGVEWAERGTCRGFGRERRPSFLSEGCGGSMFSDGWSGSLGLGSSSGPLTLPTSADPADWRPVLGADLPTGGLWGVTASHRAPR